jgi:hypothetical protein
MVLNKNLTKIGLLLLIIFLAVQSYSQKCWYDYHMKDPITDNEIKGITFNVGGFLDSRWQLELHKHGNQYFIGMYIKLNGNIREVITPENTIVFKLENGEIITIHANEDYVPTSQATQYGIVSWFNARYVIPEDDMQKIAASQLTYIRASVGTQVYGGSISKKKGKLFQSNAKCILL